ncbi:putative acetyltransferase [Marmoricola endophyticus]|uniref:Acetyltransferase n=1 Tax=Marmoricola endophyticus TaxID=2040280 RepID=A0A917F448_9ACTN|nr:GNAT family N-acetyltransferase [Marmoricola endophyticus]GGF46753.1 putative acetyltransferase [Marmoricola endophyticus]
MTVRRATTADVPRIVALVRDLAAYEKELDQATATAADFETALFGEVPTAYAHVAVSDGVDGEVVGMALWFLTFSTWTGRNGIWLEDLYVEPAHRGTRAGKALLSALARECVERGLPRLEWTVLDWNEPAIGFYRSIGARPQEEWTTQRVTGDALAALAAVAP